jgi:tetratricopeptide (TPR) repeat protein
MSQFDTKATEHGSPEGYSLFGKPLYAIKYPEDTERKYLANLAVAEQRVAQYPDDEDAIVWHGRRLGYLTRYREAIDVYTKGLEKYPDSFVLLRHRGHRLISIRRFAEAEADYVRAAQLCLKAPDVMEPDGEPNKAGVPTGTIRFNIFYHLGLSRYLQGKFSEALGDYRTCMEYSMSNDDALVATSDWLYMTLMRLGEKEEAAKVLEPIAETMEIMENYAYHHRLLLYKGLKKPEDLMSADSTTHHDTATHGYGIGNWHYCNGRKDEAKAIFEKVVSTAFWPAFGYIAAEADLYRGLD